MRVFGLLILASVLFPIAGCRTDKAANQSSSFDARTTPDGTSSSAVQPAPALAPSDGRPLLICFGDSLTAGFGADPGASYPDFLQKDLDSSSFGYRVVNEGVSGNTSKDGVERLPGIIAMKPFLVVVEFGGNDGLRGLKVQATRDNLATIVQSVQHAGIKVVLAGISLPPDYGPDYVKAFTGNYASLAKQFHVPLLPFLLQDVYGVPGLMQADNTHATDRGNEIVAKNLLPYVTPLLHK